MPDAEEVQCIAIYDLHLDQNWEVVLSHAVASVIELSRTPDHLKARIDGKPLNATSIGDLSGVRLLEIGDSLARDESSRDRIGLSFQINKQLDMSLLFVAFGMKGRSCARFGFWGEVPFWEAQSYGIGFVGEDVDGGFFRAAALTSGMPVAAEDVDSARADGRFYSERVRVPSFQREFHKEKIRSLYEINLINTRQFSAVTQSLSSEPGRFSLRSGPVGCDFHFLHLVAGELQEANDVLRRAGLLL